MTATKSIVKRLPVLYCIFFANGLLAQRIADNANSNKIDSAIILPVANEMDASDLLKKIFKGRKQHLQANSAANPKKIYATFLPVAGYTLQTGFAAALSAGLAYYTDTVAYQKISNILTSVSYTQYHQLLFPLAVNIWTKKNKYYVALDYRFLKYPSTNYGLGARTTETDAYTLNFNNIKFHQSLLRKIYKDLYGGLGFYYDYYWNITEVNPPAGVVTSFKRYTKETTKETASGIAFRLLYDSRQNQINPINGMYASVTYRPNFTFLGSDKNWAALQIEFRKYLHIFGSTKNTLALWSFNWFTMGKKKPPYLLLPSTGWDDQYNTGRGYIQSRFRAKDMIYAEAEYRFGITNNGLLGAVVFANAQSFSKNFTNQLTLISPGFGAGLRIKLNKYSDTNLSIDYGFGLNGSKGLYLNLGEVF